MLVEYTWTTQSDWSFKPNHTKPRRRFAEGRRDALDREKSPPPPDRLRGRHSPVTDDGHVGDRPTPRDHATTRPSSTNARARVPRRCSSSAAGDQGATPPAARTVERSKAEGNAYREICELTGWTYMNVNRDAKGAGRIGRGRTFALRPSTTIRGRHHVTDQGLAEVSGELTATPRKRPPATSGSNVSEASSASPRREITPSWPP
jgi:hypothetical protein